MRNSDDFFGQEKLKNSPIGYILPLVISVLYCILLGAIQYYTSISMFFFAFLSSYMIGAYMLKYLEYYTLFHKILAAFYGLIAYIVFLESYIFFMYLKFGVEESLSLIFTINGFRMLINLTSGFNLIFLIITPIASYAYLEYHSKRFSR